MGVCHTVSLDYCRGAGLLELVHIRGCIGIQMLREGGAAQDAVEQIWNIIDHAKLCMPVTLNPKARVGGGALLDSHATVALWHCLARRSGA